VAARLGNVDNVVLLLQHGASPDSATHDLYTPLHIAAKQGHDDVVSVLLEHGANQTLSTNVSCVLLKIYLFIYLLVVSVLTLLVGRQEEHPVCKN